MQHMPVKQSYKPLVQAEQNPFHYMDTHQPYKEQRNTVKRHRLYKCTYGLYFQKFYNFNVPVITAVPLLYSVQ